MGRDCPPIPPHIHARVMYSVPSGLHSLCSLESEPGGSAAIRLLSARVGGFSEANMLQAADDQCGEVTGLPPHGHLEDKLN